MTLHLKSRKQRNQHSSRGIAGVLAALILFAMIFTTAFGYLLVVTQGSASISQANAARQDALIQAGQETLLTKVVLVGTTLVASINNTGGVPVTISSIYVVDSTGKLISGPPYSSTNVCGTNICGTNVSASKWPISLPVGLSTNSLRDNIMLTGFSYTAGASVGVEILTAKGNLFSALYPTPGSIIPITDALVVRMVATPAQTLTCTGCVTVSATVYNYASSQATSVVLSPSPPIAQVTGTASITGGNCGPASPSSTISAYSGSGNAPYITFTCTYSAQTGTVGGLASFTTSAVGTLNGKGVSSAETTSNSVQIGGNSNVPTQGAFAANYFFVKYSSCQNAPSGSVGSYTYSSPCTTNPSTMPPSSVKALADANYISAISDFYVTYYMQVTNAFNTTLPILKYSFLFMDPGITTEGYSFLVGVNNSAFRTNGAYYPNYNPGGGGLPTLTAYPSDCNVVYSTASPGHPANSPQDSNCIYVNPGQTVTLTFAACGYGLSNWVWGGTPYAQQLDNTAGCITNAPNYKGYVPEGQTFAVVLSYPYKNQVYLQTMPFEGQTVTNLRTSTTAIACSPSPDAVNSPSTCTATVTDIATGTPITPTGTVTFLQTPATGGTFSNGGTCTLSGSGATATCALTYTPSLGQEGTDTLTATYPGDTNHSPSAGITSLIATRLRSTSTSVVCTPSATIPNTPTNCVITVTDTSTGTTITPAGTITLTQNPASSGTFTPAATCTLASGTCSVTYTPNTNLVGTVTITGSYGGDSVHSVSSNSASVTWASYRSTSLTISCSNPPVNQPVSCTFTVTDTSSGTPITPTGIVDTFSDGGKGGSFGGGSCTLSTGVCTVTYTRPSCTVTTTTISAKYEGDSNHNTSTGSTSLTSSLTFATVNGQSPVACVPVTLTNNQGSATPSNFQEMITVNSNNYHSYLASDLSNVNWQDGSGNILNSWRESGVSSSDTNDPYWVNLGSHTMAASGGSLVIYYCLYGTSVNVLNTANTGEAPQLTSTYGQYDDGANVFTQYGGRSWSSLTTVGGTWDTTNGYLEQTATTGSYTGGPAALIEGTTYPANGNYIIESAFSYTSQANARVGLVAVQSLISGDPYGYRFLCQQGNNGAGCISFLNDWVVWHVNGVYQGATSTPYTMSIVDNAGTWSGTLYSGYGITGSSLTALPATAYTSANDNGATTGYVGVSAGYYTGSAVVANPAHFQWFRLRLLPPGNVMPSASFGSLAMPNLPAQLGAGYNASTNQAFAGSAAITSALTLTSSASQALGGIAAPAFESLSPALQHTVNPAATTRTYRYLELITVT